MRARVWLPLAAVVTGLLSGCASEPELPREGKAPSAAEVCDAVAAELVPQLPDSLAVAVARPIVAKGERRRQQERYPDLLLSALVRAARLHTPRREVRFLTRQHLLLLLQEQGLQWSDLMPTDPQTRVKLKKIAAVEAYVVWRIDTGKASRTTVTDPGIVLTGKMKYEDWSLMVLSVQTGEILAASKVHRVWLGWAPY